MQDSPKTSSTMEQPSMPTRSSCLPPGLWTAPSPLTPSLLPSRAFPLLTAPDVQDVLALHTAPAHLLLLLGLCILSLLRGPSSTHSHPSHSPSPALFFFPTFSALDPTLCTHLDTSSQPLTGLCAQGGSGTCHTVGSHKLHQAKGQITRTKSYVKSSARVECRMPKSSYTVYGHVWRDGRSPWAKFVVVAASDEGRKRQPGSWQSMEPLVTWCF